MLHGVRVVELGVWAAGPGAGVVLADWGADVIKVEGPDGDPARQMLAVTGGGRADLPNPTFDLDNRGKRSVVLDLADPDGAGRTAMAALLATADVFLTNLRPEAVERLGLGVEDVLAAHPRLVYASVTGFGRTGPDSHRAGYDFGGFWAWSGVASLAVPDGDPQPHFPAAMGDHATAMATVAGILGALLERHGTGRGRLVETSLLRTGTWCAGWPLNLQLRFGKVAGTPRRTEVPNPMINPYQAGDGRWFWLLGTESQRLWVKLAPAIERPELLDDERFATPRDRRHRSTELVALLDEVFAQRSLAAWMEVFDAHDVWWAPVNRPEDVLADPQAIAAGAFVDVPGGPGADAHRSVASPVSFPGEAGDGSQPQGPVPALGEHTAEILAELGLS